MFSGPNPFIGHCFWLTPEIERFLHSDGKVRVAANRPAVIRRAARLAVARERCLTSDRWTRVICPGDVTMESWWGHVTGRTAFSLTGCSDQLNPELGAKAKGKQQWLQKIQHRWTNMSAKAPNLFK